VRANSKAAALECLVERIDTGREPSPFDRQAEVLDAELKQSFGGPGSPGESSARWRHTAILYERRAV